ncbi:hypothetical protein VMCG_01019 [Cytospora schulzeri]|uniref:Fumarylacetoacetase-like C-terminal domain-containing protein n=1 Tax=Cytospora schulzeri TaxID=448051 RepID=A0A423X4Q4_9PEZI|nr:hypothetical protein VMCG_01019 [Valsa malicola]
MRTAWQRLIRFVATDGGIYYGEPLMPSPDFDMGSTTEDTQLQAKVIQGEDLYDTSGVTKVTDKIVTVKKLLGPLAPRDVPILRCIGLNYAKHSNALPKTPVMFFKPSTAVHDHGADVIIPKICQDEQADYEGELCIIIGQDAKDVPASRALDYVAAYTAGNDISSRRLQLDRDLAGPMPQADFSKGFDTFAPLGPALVSTTVITSPRGLMLRTTVDGEVRQEGETDDLVFGVQDLVAYLSTGTTLQKGSVIMTGTPGGVGSRMRPPRWLVPGTKMEVHITKIGTLKNGVSFA